MSRAVACAVVDKDGNVINMIMADPAWDKAPKGMTIVARPAGSTVDRNWVLKSGSFEMRPEYLAAKQAAEAELARNAGETEK
jgi:hypothetical protein